MKVFWHCADVHIISASTDTDASDFITSKKKVKEVQNVLLENQIIFVFIYIIYIK